MEQYAFPRSMVTFLVWSRKLKGPTTLDIMLKDIPFDPAKRELKRSQMPRTESPDDKDFYRKFNLPFPDAEFTLSSKDLTPIQFPESTSLYWLLSQRGLSVLTYILDEEGKKVVDNVTPDLRDKVPYNPRINY